MPKLIPVYNQEKSLKEQDDKELIKHRNWDYAHSLVKLKNEDGICEDIYDNKPYLKKSKNLVKNEKGLWVPKKRKYVEDKMEQDKNKKTIKEDIGHKEDKVYNGEKGGKALQDNKKYYGPNKQNKSSSYSSSINSDYSTSYYKNKRRKKKNKEKKRRSPSSLSSFGVSNSTNSVSESMSLKDISSNANNYRSSKDYKKITISKKSKNCKSNKDIDQKWKDNKNKKNKLIKKIKKKCSSGKDNTSDPPEMTTESENSDLSSEELKKRRRHYVDSIDTISNKNVHHHNTSDSSTGVHNGSNRNKSYSNTSDDNSSDGKASDKLSSLDSDINKQKYKNNSKFWEKENRSHKRKKKIENENVYDKNVTSSKNKHSAKIDEIGDKDKKMQKGKQKPEEKEFEEDYKREHDDESEHEIEDMDNDEDEDEDEGKKRESKSKIIEDRSVEKEKRKHKHRHHGEIRRDIIREREKRHRFKSYRYYYRTDIKKDKKYLNDRKDKYRGNEKGNKSYLLKSDEEEDYKHDNKKYYKGESYNPQDRNDKRWNYENNYKHFSHKERYNHSGSRHMHSRKTQLRDNYHYETVEDIKANNITNVQEVPVNNREDSAHIENKSKAKSGELMRIDDNDVKHLKRVEEINKKFQEKLEEEKTMQSLGLPLGFV
ncbi:conserved Plasmodium protein, unknown function [Plasmodium malariae]|uniref:Uncharacterized protein n=1 Tax=Plasmodium malariae TaxID=5858 RepID=A0A1D3RIB8_PLAMA|nr:conserved Plasmodium protein, unknown function [Plasmodium malariae]SCN44767.1 conserved Plasmodium protein, unknown function [Plasmodium malariae]